MIARKRASRIDTRKRKRCVVVVCARTSVPLSLVDENRKDSLVVDESSSVAFDVDSKRTPSRSMRRGVKFSHKAGRLRLSPSFESQGLVETSDVARSAILSVRKRLAAIRRSIDVTLTRGAPVFSRVRSFSFFVRSPSSRFACARQSATSFLRQGCCRD